MMRPAEVPTARSPSPSERCRRRLVLEPGARPQAWHVYVLDKWSLCLYCCRSEAETWCKAKKGVGGER